MNKQQTPRKERNVGLDLLRISLALLIFMFHSNMHFDCHYGVFDHFARYGAIAMTGFFMLSGYALSLSSKVILTDIGSLKNFLLKRFISIYPLYYFVALAFIILLGSESFQSLALLFPFEALGLQSCFTSLSKISHNGGTWFISCLTICYLLYPLLQWIIIRLKVKEKVILGGGIFIPFISCTTCPTSF
ncbi:acyltransferase family protein [Xylanibacter ruminicola]|uniref:acyltransferase family protein n=1 Tax=Xylanibacter ruminicola TaxID=839 RepID=UPI0009BCE85B|nr:acyltransferase [Xylanibacter ruminicola]